MDVCRAHGGEHAECCAPGAATVRVQSTRRAWVHGVIARHSRSIRAWLTPFALLLTGCAVPALVVPHARAPFHPTLDALRGAPLYFYPARDTTHPPRAFVFFFGNDVGFWRAHQRLAELLSTAGYTVVGCDLRRVFGALPHGATRRTTYLARIDSLITNARAAVGAAHVPLVIAGHSIGGEVAVWTAASLRAPDHEPGLVGVVTLSPGQRGHLGTGLSDLLGREPHGVDSFAVDSEVARLTPQLRVALVRGERDGFRRADATIVAAGARRFPVARQGHSLLGLRAVEPVVLAALAYVTDTVPRGSP